MTPKNESPADSGTPLRGVALVDAVMAKREADGDRLEGCAPEQLEVATLGDRPLTPALRRWRERDDEMFVLAEPQSFAELIEAEFPEWAEYFEPLAALLTEPCVLFEDWGADSRRFIYLGQVDEHGEYPVFTLDTDDVPYVCLNGPVDVWLAQHAGLLEDEHVYGFLPEAYEPTRETHAKLNFGGFMVYEHGELSGHYSSDG